MSHVLETEGLCDLDMDRLAELDMDRLAELDMDRLAEGCVQDQRKAVRQEPASRHQCPHGDAELQLGLEAFKAHSSLKHPELAGDETASSRRGSRKICSPPTSVTQQRGSSPPTPGRTRAKPSEWDGDFVRRNTKLERQVWTGDDDRKRASPQRPRPPQTRRGQLRQPDTRPTSPDELAAEVQGIYVGLLLLENQCIEYDISQKDAASKYQALASLHQLEGRQRFLEQRLPDVASNVRHGLKERFVLPITINNETHHALPDTMASRNVISKKYAASIGAAVNWGRAKQHPLMNAIGKKLPVIGETTLEVSFPDEPLKKMRQTFAVVKKCAVDLVMGDTFLRTTETLTKFKARRKRDIGTMKKSWRLCYMGAPHRQLPCSIDGEAVLADADTGSDIDVVSLKYAKRRGWFIHDLKPENRDVELSDGSTVQLAGYVGALLNVGGRRETKLFYVLDRLQCHVVLGDETLYSLDAFNQHEALFVDDDAAECRRFCAIKWKERVDDHVNQILGHTLPPRLSTLPDTKKRSVWRRLVGGAFGTSPAEEVRAWTVAFQSSLEIIETMETDCQNQASKQMESLVGHDLQIAKDGDERRRRQYQEQKNRILAQMQDFQRSWRAFDKHTEAVPRVKFV